MATRGTLRRKWIEKWVVVSRKYPQTTNLSFKTLSDRSPRVSDSRRPWAAAPVAGEDGVGLRTVLLQPEPEPGGRQAARRRLPHGGRRRRRRFRGRGAAHGFEERRFTCLIPPRYCLKPDVFGTNSNSDVLQALQFFFACEKPAYKPRAMNAVGKSNAMKP